MDLRPKDPAIRELCCKHQTQLAIVLLRLSRHAEAAVAARELSRLAPDDPAVLLRAARILAGCVPLAERDPGTPWVISLALAQSLRGESINLAGKAVARGLPYASRLLADPDFDPVRSCEEFRLLLREVSAPE